VIGRPTAAFGGWRVARLALALAAASALTLGGLGPAAAQGTVTAAGAVANGTGAGAPPAGATVTVAAGRGGQPIDQATTTLAADGRFAVAGLPAGPDLTYRARVEHDGVAYWSEPVRLDAGGALPPLAVTVYERTDDPASVAVERHAIAVLSPDAAERSLEVLEVVSLRNAGDRTWAPRVDGPAGPMGLLRFSLPDGATDLRPGGGLRGEEILLVDRGFATDMPVVPGRQEVAFSYRIRYGTGDYRLAKTFPYATGLVQVQVPIEIAGGAVGLAEVAPGEAATVDGRIYRQLQARGLAPRATIALQLGGLPGAPPPVLSGPVRLGVLGLAVVAALVPIAYARARGRQAPAAVRLG
jgi:hypothetical protein